MKQRPSRVDKCQRAEKRQQKLHRIAPNQRRLPDRWIDYDPVGKDMTGTRFVAFKTPLRHDYFLNRSNEFDIQNIFETKNLIDMISFLICILECTKKVIKLRK
ncbi:unnamed protein product [Onchocerca flexuosa]|uniref:Uncharacterized protein n=1 Tax=Onchocerca flexuosa TaxID=387005 RepID=A0A183HMH1_9BILA|nr:unnamed protein product [Onchocerca flexuosa]